MCPRRGLTVTKKNHSIWNVNWSTWHEHGTKKNLSPFYPLSCKDCTPEEQGHLKEFMCDRHSAYCYNYSVIFIFSFILYLTSWKVCELDIIFNFEKAYFMLDELILGGEIQETSKKNVLKAISAQDLLQEVWKSFLVVYSIPSLFLHSQVGGNVWLSLIVVSSTIKNSIIHFVAKHHLYC